MSGLRRFVSAQDFRQALEHDIQSRCEAPEDIMFERAGVAFERVLHRFDNKEWHLKGGCALRLLSPNARFTQDIDLVLKDRSLLTLSGKARVEEIRNRVMESLLSAQEHEDYFEFDVRNALEIGDLSPVALAAMILVGVKVGGTDFCHIRIDVGIEDEEILPGEPMSCRDSLAFAGIKNPDCVITAPELIFAEKLMAYSSQGEDGLRTRDLIDMLLLLERGLDAERVKHALQQVCKQQGLELPSKLNPPPKSWADEFQKLCRQCKLELSMAQAYNQVRSFSEPLLGS